MQPRIITSFYEITDADIAASINVKDLTIVDHIPCDLRGTINEYHSDADYWWPSADGQPYTRKDGQTNPAIFSKHRQTLRALRIRLSTLVLATINGNDLAEKALKSQINTFFINKATLMEPHLYFSQAISGRCTGRSEGIIDGLHLAEIAVAINVWLTHNDLEDHEELTLWFKNYFHFLTQTPWGKKEMERENNHASAYWLQVLAIAVLLKDTVWIAMVNHWLETNLYVNQMSKEGHFPAELARTKPLGYSIFQINSLTMIHQLLYAAGYKETWNYSLNGTKCFEKALLWILPYMTDKKTWPYAKDLQYFEDLCIRQPALYIGSIICKMEHLQEIFFSLSPVLIPEELERNMPATCLPLWNLINNGE